MKGLNELAREIHENAVAHGWWDIVNILGTEYTVEGHNPGEDKRLNNCDGYTDFTVRKISVLIPETTEGSVEDMSVYVNRVLRCEITRAFLMENGLMQNTNQVEHGGAFDERFVDWIAIQGPKIYAAWQEVGAV